MALARLVARGAAVAGRLAPLPAARAGRRRRWHANDRRRAASRKRSEPVAGRPHRRARGSLLHSRAPASIRLLARQRPAARRASRSCCRSAIRRSRGETRSPSPRASPATSAGATPTARGAPSEHVRLWRLHRRRRRTLPALAARLRASLRLAPGMLRAAAVVKDSSGPERQRSWRIASTCRRSTPAPARRSASPAPRTRSPPGSPRRAATAGPRATTCLLAPAAARPRSGEARAARSRDHRSPRRLHALRPRGHLLTMVGVGLSS